MTSSNVRQLLKQHLEADDFMIRVNLNHENLNHEAFYLCFPKDSSVDIFRLERNHITYHAKEVSPDLDSDDIELHCLDIEEQHAADNNQTQVD